MCAHHWTFNRYATAPGGGLGAWLCTECYEARPATRPTLNKRPWRLKQVAALRFLRHAIKPLPASCASVGITITPKEGGAQADADALIADIDGYLKDFAAPVGDSNGGKCFHCGEYLTGMMAALLAKGGGFRWGMAHGEGMCGNCAWPARAYHRPKRDDGSQIFSATNLILQYHPRAVSRRKTQTENT